MEVFQSFDGEMIFAIVAITWLTLVLTITRIGLQLQIVGTDIFIGNERIPLQEITGIRDVTRRRWLLPDSYPTYRINTYRTSCLEFLSQKHK